MEALSSSGPAQFNVSHYILMISSASQAHASSTQELVTACDGDHTRGVSEKDMLGVRNQTLADIRKLVIGIRLPDEPSRRPNLAPEVRFIHDIREDPIAHLSTFEKELWPELVTQRSLGTWYDALQHKLMIAFALIAVVDDPSIETKPLRLKYVFHAVEEVRGFVYTSVHPKYPSQARKLNAAVQGLSGAALKAIGGVEALERAM